MTTLSKFFSLGSLSLVFAASVVACGGGTDAPATTGGTNTASGSAEGGSKMIGNPGPDFSGTSVAGSKVALASLQGKVAIVDFWATWCEPCKKSFPKLEELNVKYKGQLEILAVSEDDDKAGLADFGKAHGAKFTLLWDDGKAIANKWKPENMPTTFILDKKGVVRFVHQGYHDGEEVEIEKEIKGLL